MRAGKGWQADNSVQDSSKSLQLSDDRACILMRCGTHAVIIASVKQITGKDAKQVKSLLIQSAVTTPPLC